MKNPLQYQRTEYDCGPTSVLNALSYLFHRNEIPPDIIKNVMLYCLDSYNSKGDHGKSGTSYTAMMFLSNWLNQYGRAKKYPIQTEYLFGANQVSVSPNSSIITALRMGGVVIARVVHGCWHYVLLTEYDGEYISLWDPYYRKRPFRIPGLDIEMITDSPTKNRRIRTEVLDETGKKLYALGAPETREAVLFFNKAVCEKPIEYYI